MDANVSSQVVVAQTLTLQPGQLLALDNPHEAGRIEAANDGVLGEEGAIVRSRFDREELLKLRMARRGDDHVGDLAQHRPATLAIGRRPVGGEPATQATDDGQPRDAPDEQPAAAREPHRVGRSARSATTGR